MGNYRPVVEAVYRASTCSLSSAGCSVRCGMPNTKLGPEAFILVLSIFPSPVSCMYLDRCPHRPRPARCLLCLSQGMGMCWDEPPVEAVCTNSPGSRID